MSLITHLTCVQCGTAYKEGKADTCPRCGRDEGILDVHFDIERARKTLTRESLKTRTRSHWRYRELLPLDDPPCSGRGREQAYSDIKDAVSAGLREELRSDDVGE